MTNQSPHEQSSKTTKLFIPLWLMAIMLLIITALGYFNGMTNELIFDDYALVENLKCNDGISKIPAMFTQNHDENKCAYRRMRYVSYAIDYTLFGNTDLGYHISNLVWHLLTTLLVFLIGLKILKKPHLAFLMALLWAIHPVQADSVTYVSGRRDVLCGFFFMAGFYSYIRFSEKQKIGWFFVFALSFIMGMMTKEMVVTLPAVILLYDAVRIAVENQSKGSKFGVKKWLSELWKRRWWLYTLLFILAGAFVLYRGFYRSHSNMDGRLWGGSYLNNYLTVGAVYLRYFEMILAPIRLLGDYSQPTIPVVKSFSDPRWMLGAVITMLLLIGALFSWKKRPWVIFGVFFYFISMLPVSHIIPHHELMAEHYLYIPLFGLSIAVISIADEVAQSITLKRWVIGLGIIWFTFSFGRLVIRNEDFTSNQTFFETTYYWSPDSLRANLWLGDVHRHTESYDKALEYYEDIIEISPRSRVAGDAYERIAAIRTIKGEPAKAIEYWLKLVALEPRNGRAFRELGILLGKTRSFEKAEKILKRAATLRPDDSIVFVNLGVTLLHMGKFEEACPILKKSVELSPDSIDAIFQLGNCYLETNRVEMAIDQFSIVVQEKPDWVPGLVQLGFSYLKTAQFEKAAQTAETLYNIAPSDPGTVRFITELKRILGR